MKHIHGWVLGLIFLIGCMHSGPKLASVTATFALKVGEHVESPVGFRLLSIAEDERTTVLLDSGESYSAKPGEQFDFRLSGRNRPILKSASHRKGVAVIIAPVH